MPYCRPFVKGQIYFILPLDKDGERVYSIFMKVCRVKDCTGKYYVKDYCRKHYHNFMYCGDPLGAIHKYALKLQFGNGIKKTVFH